MTRAARASFRLFISVNFSFGIADKSFFIPSSLLRVPAGSPEAEQEVLDEGVGPPAEGSLEDGRAEALPEDNRDEELVGDSRADDVLISASETNAPRLSRRE